MRISEDNVGHRFEDLQAAIDELNSLEWSVLHREQNGEHMLFVGTSHFASFESIDEMRVFLAGMATYQAHLPDEAVELLRELFAE